MAQKASARHLKAMEHRERALDLRIRGMSYARIGAAIGFGTMSAWKAVQAALKETIERTAENADRLRALEVERLDRLADMLWPVVDASVTDEQAQTRQLRERALDAATALLRLSERRARLLGLDAPVKVAATDGSGRDLPPAPPVSLDLSRLAQEQLDALENLLETAAQEVVH